MVVLCCGICLLASTACAFSLREKRKTQDYFLRDGISKPVISISNGTKNQKLTSSGMAVTIQMTSAAGVNIRYTINGTEPKCRRSPVGMEYTGPIQLCGSASPTVVKAIACKANKDNKWGSSEESSEVARETFNIQPFLPPPPAPPEFSVDPPSACIYRAATKQWACVLQPGAETLRLQFSMEDRVCTSADYDDRDS